MKTNRGFNAENFKKLFDVRNVVRSISVFADGGDPVPAEPNADPNNGAGNGGGTDPVNFEALIAKAREEEKNKLYPKIKKLEEANNGYIQTHNDDLIAIATKDKEIDKLKAEIKTLQTQIDGNESEAVISLKNELKAAQDELEKLRKDAPNEEAIRATVRAEIEAEYEIKFYREKKIQEAGGKIIPELVSGNTTEEIDASVEAAKTRYNDIVGSVTPAPAVNPTVNPANPSSTPLKTNADAMKALMELDPTSPEYREARKALGFK